MNRSEVRKRVYAGMQGKRAKHIITGKELEMEGRQWIWDYWNNYKAATVGLSMFGIVLCLISIVFMLSAKSAYINNAEGRTGEQHGQGDMDNNNNNNNIDDDDIDVVVGNTLCDWT